MKLCFGFQNNIFLKSIFRDFEEDDPDWVSELQMLLKQSDWKPEFTCDECS